MQKDPGNALASRVCNATQMAVARAPCKENLIKLTATIDMNV
jgi:hypothetical protein